MKQYFESGIIKLLLQQHKLQIFDKKSAFKIRKRINMKQYFESGIIKLLWQQHKLQIFDKKKRLQN